MARVFNTSGPCEPEEHYMLPAEDRLSDARRLIDLTYAAIVLLSRICAGSSLALGAPASSRLVGS
ncbi:MAG: ATP-binding protein, partial [bacterium]|nr:ATP-binding protein [bacterium]